MSLYCNLATGQLFLSGAVIKAANIAEEGQGSLVDDSFDGNCTTEDVHCRVCNGSWKRQYMFDELLLFFGDKAAISLFTTKI